MKRTLQALYWILLPLDIITILLWLAGFSFVIPVIPATATIAIFVLHIHSLKDLKLQGYISPQHLRRQSILGVGIAGCFGCIVYTLSSLDCLDVCTHPPGYNLTYSLPQALIATALALTVVVIPHLANKKLVQKATR